MHAVVVSILPLEIRAQRKSYLTAEIVAGLARGTVMTFVLLEEAATKVKAAAPKKGPRFVRGRHHGIIACAEGRFGEHLVWTSISSLDREKRADAPLHNNVVR